MADPVVLSNVYDIVVTFENLADPTITWRNTFTVFSPDTPVHDTTIALAISGFCKAMIWPDSAVVKVACYSWGRGSHPYPSGSALWENVGSVEGTADSNWPHLNATHHPAGGEVALRVDHATAAIGRPGRSFFRTLLGKDDITALSGGKWTTVPTIVNLQTDLLGVLAASTLGSYFGGGSGGQYLTIVRYSPKTNTVHGNVPVSSFQVIGATTSKRFRSNKR